MSSTARAMVAVLALSLIGGIGFLLMRSASKGETKVARHASEESAPQPEPTPQAEIPTSNPASLLGATASAPLAPGRIEDLAPAVAGAALPRTPPNLAALAPPTDEQRAVAAIAALPEPQIRQAVETLAARHPDLKVESIDCIDRPCRATVTGTDEQAMRDLAREMGDQYDGHVRIDIGKSRDPGTGEKIIKGRITIGADRHRGRRRTGPGSPGTH